MAKNTAFRVYPDEEVMLEVYGRRLRMADRRFDKTRSQRDHFVARYRGEVEEDQVTPDGHQVSVSLGVGIIDTMFSSMTAVEVEFSLRNIGNDWDKHHNLMQTLKIKLENLVRQVIALQVDRE